MLSAPSSAPAARKASVFSRVLRFKWPAFSALVIFLAVYSINVWFTHHGLRREATLLDNLLLSGLVFGLGVANQLRQEGKLQRHRQLASIISDMNHHTRNALQVIVNRSSQSIADSDAIEDIREAVKRIDWCLREILPNADESVTRKPPRSEALDDEQVNASSRR